MRYPSLRHFVASLPVGGQDLEVPLDGRVWRRFGVRVFHVTSAATAVEHPEEALREWLARETFGSLHALDVRVTRDLDADEREAWFFDVVLPNPGEGEDTWPVEDINRVHLATRDKALELGLDWPWYVRFRPQTEGASEEPDDAS